MFNERSSQQKVIRIGILAPASLGFAPWELRLFERIASDPRFEIQAVIIDGRNPPPPKTIFEKLTDKKLPQRLFYRAMMSFDERAAGIESTPETPVFNALLIGLKKITVNPERRRFVDLFTEADTKAVRELELDVILRHDFGIIKGPILEAARHGIWSFHHADNRHNRGGPPGFWESLHQAPVTGATLQILTPELDGGRVIARCWRNTEPNAIRNERAIYDLSCTLVWRELTRLARDGFVPSEPSELYDGPLYVAPGIRDLFRYAAKRISNTANGLVHHLNIRSGRRPGMWSLATGTGQIETAALWRTTEIKPPADRFWADPFLIDKDGTLHLFFEEFDYQINRGYISVGILNDGKFTYLGKAIDAGYHMSFPFVYVHNGDIYMIPEAAEKRRVEVWRATDFPLSWERHKTVLEETDIADTTLHFHDDQWWMFANISQTPNRDFCNELHVFMIDGPELESITPHPENPVVMDSRTARNGGRMFYRGDKLYRPSQNNSYGTYGYGLNIMEITELTPTRYQEKRVVKAEPNFRKDIGGLHHVDAVGDTFVIDIWKPVGGRPKSK